MVAVDAFCRQRPMKVSMCPMDGGQGGKGKEVGLLMTEAGERGRDFKQVTKII